MIQRLRAWAGSARSRVGSAVLVASAMLLGLLTTEFALGRWAF